MLTCVWQKWAEIIGQAGQSIDILKNQDVIRSVLNILQVIMEAEELHLTTIALPNWLAAILLAVYLLL
jgi:hypothetical protein